MDQIFIHICGLLVFIKDYGLSSVDCFLKQNVILLLKLCMNSCLFLFAQQLECQKPGNLAQIICPFCVHGCTAFPCPSATFTPVASVAVTGPGCVAVCLLGFPQPCTEPHSPGAAQLRLHYMSENRGLSDADFVMVLS